MTFTFALNAILSLSLISNLYSPVVADGVGKFMNTSTLQSIAVAEERVADWEAPAEIFSFTPAIPIETREVWLTAYSSTPEETDDTPFVTATGNHVRDGIVATNFLPFGTRVRIPEVFGDKIFVVDDRMHPRKTDFMDVWMPSKQDALNLGIRRTNIVVLAPIGTPDSRN